MFCMKNAKRLLAILLAVMVCLCSFPVVLAQEEGQPVVQSVEVDSVQRILGTGYMNWEPIFDEDGGYIGQTEEYMEYDIMFSSGRITFAGGDVVEITGTSFEYQGNWYEISLTNPQGYNNQWTKVGDYQVQGSVLGFGFSYTVTLTPSPVKSIECTNLVYVENTHGDFTKDSLYNDNGEYVGESDPYYCYNLYPNYKITLTDGSVIENDGFNWEGQWYGVNYFPQQDFHSQWKKGNTYTVPVECVGVKSSFTVTIVESPVERIEIKPVSVVEKTHGDYVKDWLDIDNQIYADPYFAYHVPSYMEMEYTVTLKNGTVFTQDDAIVVDGVEYELEFEAYSNQHYTAPWVAGNTYYAKASCLGKETQYAVTILESPVESIEFAPITIKEFEEGYYTRDWIENPNGEPTEQTEEYFKYNFSMNDIFVTLKDGTKQNIIYDDLVYQGVPYYFSYDCDRVQNYQNQWVAGETYQVPYTFCGKEGTFPVTVAKDYSNEVYQAIGTEGGVIITGYKGETQISSLEIPGEIDGKPVIGVADLGYLYIEELVLPDSVVTLGDQLFPTLPDLKTIHLGAGIDNFTPQMIEENSWLEAIVVDENHPRYATKDGVLYSKGYSQLIAVPLSITELEIPKTCTDCGVLDLMMYASLSVKYEEGHPDFVTVDGVTYTKDMKTVVTCDKAKEGVYHMPPSVETIKPKAFLDCDGLTEVSVSDKVTEIVYAAFAGCKSLTTVTLPEQLKTIGEYSFAETYELSNVTFPNTLEVIEQEAFLDGGLTRVILPDSVKEVATYAFWCNPITLLDLGQVQDIGSFAFGECALQRVTIPDSVTVMRRYAFGSNHSLKSVVIGKGLTQIEEGTFAACGLVSVTVPKNVEFIGESAFASCGNLVAVDIQNPACGLGRFAFAGCNLQSLTLGNQLSEIPEGAFQGNGFSKVEIPQSVTSLVYGAFWDCENLKDITLPNNLTHFGGHVLDNTAWYNAQKDGVVNKDYVTIGWKGKDTAPISVSIPNTTKLIADYAFEDCAKLTSVTLPAGLETIGDYAFYGCKTLTTITIPKSVKNIGQNAFRGCMALTNITVEAGNPYFYMENGKLCSHEGVVVFDPSIQNKIAYLEVLRTPYKTQYQQGEPLDTAGLKLEVLYESNFYDVITEGFTAQWGHGEDSVWVDITFGGEQTGYWVSFTQEEEAYVTGVDLLKYPTKTTYEYMEEINLAGIELLEKYSDGTTKKVTELTDDYYFSSNAHWVGSRNMILETPGGYMIDIPITVKCSHARTYTHPATPSTCSTHGHGEYAECADCGGVAKGSNAPLPLDATNHPNFKYVGKVEPTCQKAGYSGDKVCADCGKILEKGKDLEKIGHSPVWSSIQEATTTQKGVKVGFCDHCGEKFMVETEKLVETFDNKKVEGLQDVTVTLENNTAVPAESVFVVENVTNTLDYLENHTVKSALEENGVYDSTTMVVLDMGFVTRETTKDGSALADQKVDFNGEVTITLPAPKEILEAENEVYLFHVKDDGSVEKVEYTLKNGVVTFIANGFSYYVFADMSDVMLYTPYGDLDADGYINAKDALMVLKLAVNKLEMTDELFARGDVNFDESVNAKDALEILKFAVGKPSVLDEIYLGGE